jgi:hypothetical protein
MLASDGRALERPGVSLIRSCRDLVARLRILEKWRPGPHWIFLLDSTASWDMLGTLPEESSD